MLWKILAWYLVRHPLVTGRLLLQAMKTPYYHLDGYMQRWWLIEPLWGVPASEQGPISGSRFHEILRADKERHPHNHPWEFRSIILQGWYVEEIMRPDGSVYTVKRKAGRSHRCEHGTYHRIIEVSDGGVLTLVILGRKQPNSWGFWVNGVHVNWRDYLGVQDAQEAY